MSVKHFVVGITLSVLGIVTAGAGYLLYLNKSQMAQSNGVVAESQNSVPSSDDRNGPFPDNYQRTSLKAPGFDLVDQHGSHIQLAQYRGKTVVLSFVFAHCSAVCPVLVKSLNDAAKEFPRDTVTLLLTLDPERDTPQTLAHTAQQWQLGENMHFLSGDPQIVQKALSDYQIPTSRDSATGEVTHPALVYVINPEGDIAYTLNSPSKAWLLGAVQRASVPGT